MEGKKKILVVDDETDILQATKSSLERYGYSVTIAPNGAEGLRVACQEHPDLIISDVILPGMDGYTFFKQLRNDDLTLNIPVIICSALEEAREPFKELGANEIIIKPFTRDELLRKVKMCLTHTSSSDSTSPNRLSTGHKLLIGGSSNSDAQDLVLNLNAKGVYTDWVTKGEDVISKAVKSDYDIILVDVNVLGVPAHEVIKSLRAISKFRKTTFLVFSFITDEEQSSGFAHIKDVSSQQASQKSLDIGAHAYLGRLTEGSLVEKLETYL